MALHITKPGERIPVGTINILLYGQPGVGKSSIGYTCSRPLVLDFDNGAHRSMQATLGTTVRIDSWGDIGSLMQSDLSQYDTIVLDTVGRALDYMAAHIIAANPKRSNGMGGLSMQGWGELKGMFTAWLKQVNVLGKNVVMIAHAKEEKENDSIKKRPDVQGGSYAEVLKAAEFMGYYHYDDRNRRVIGFAPHTDYYGKDSANLNVVEVPDFTTVKDFGTQLIGKMKSAFLDMAESMAQTAAAVDEWRDTIEGWSTADEINDALPQFAQMPGVVRTQVRHLVGKRAKELGLVVSEGRYVQPELAA